MPFIPMRNRDIESTSWLGFWSSVVSLRMPLTEFVLKVLTCLRHCCRLEPGVACRRRSTRPDSIDIPLAKGSKCQTIERIRRILVNREESPWPSIRRHHATHRNSCLLGILVAAATANLATIPSLHPRLNISSNIVDINCTIFNLSG